MRKKEKKFFYIFPSFNALTIIFRKKNYLKYLKYINNLSSKKNIIRFEAEFEVLN